jgi:hypothetical protein
MKNEKIITWEVTEDNGGGLTLYVWDDTGLIYAHAGYEYDGTRTQLRNDIAALCAGDNTDDWDGNDLYNEDIIRYVRVHDDTIYDDDDNIIPLTHTEYYNDDPSTRIIVTGGSGKSSRALPSDMGRAGRNALYPVEEIEKIEENEQ